MILSFLFGFFFALSCVVGGVVFVFHKLNTQVVGSLREAATQRAEKHPEVEAAASLDPVKIISKVQFGTFDAIAHVPSSMPVGDEARLMNYNRAAGRSLRYGRITLIGSVISVYETVVVDRSGHQKPLKEKLKPRKKGDSLGILGSSSASPSGSSNAGGGGGADKGASSFFSDLKAGEPASERLVGKIPISRLSVSIETLHDTPHPPTGTASVGTRFLVLRRLPEVGTGGAERTASSNNNNNNNQRGGAAAVSSPPTNCWGGPCDPADSLESPLNTVYTFPPTLDGADEGEGVLKWLSEQKLSRAVALNSPPLFSVNGARPDSKRGVVTVGIGSNMMMRTQQQQQGDTTTEGSATSATREKEKEISAFSHHEDTPVRWRTLFIRFTTVRELERWFDVLQPTIVTNQWKIFLKSLPQVDAVNVLASRVFFENRELHEFTQIVTEKINKSLRKVAFPSQLGSSNIVASEVNVGGEMPIFSNISPIATSACGEVALDLDIWYRGGFTCRLLIDLALQSDKLIKLDFKAPSVEATVHLKELKGRMHLSIGAPPSHKMWLGFHELPEVDVELNLELVKNENTGTIAKLVMNAIPDLSDIITNIVREKLFEDMTLPHLDDFPVPNVEKTPPPTPRGSEFNKAFNNLVNAEAEALARDRGDANLPSARSSGLDPQHNHHNKVSDGGNLTLDARAQMVEGRRGGENGGSVDAELRRRR